MNHSVFAASLKQRAKFLRAALKSELNTDISIAQSLEMVAKEENFPNWDTACASYRYPAASQSVKFAHCIACSRIACSRGILTAHSKQSFNLDEKINGESVLIAIENGRKISDNSLHLAAGVVLLKDLKLLDMDDDVRNLITRKIENNYEFAVVGIDLLNPNTANGVLESTNTQSFDVNEATEEIRSVASLTSRRKRQ